MFLKIKLILWKNFIVRKRHWFLTITEFAIPIVLFALIAYGRSKITGLNKEEAPARYTEPLRSDVLYSNLPVGRLYLCYAPYTDFTESIINKVQEKFQIVSEDMKSFATEEELILFYQKHSNEEKTIASIIFRGENKKYLNYDLSLREKNSEWNTERLYFDFDDLEVQSAEITKYIHHGFTALQLAIDTAFIEVSMGVESLSNVTFSIQEFPYPPHTRDDGLNQLFIHFLPLMTIFCFIFLCPSVLKRVVEEKFSGIKELMKMVGMSSWMIWMGWFLHALTTNIFSIIVIVVLMKTCLWGVPYAPIEHCDGVVLFVFLLLFCLAATSLCFFISTLFSKPSLAMLTGILVWIFSYFIPKAVLDSYQNMLWRYKILLGLFPNMALNYGYSAIAVYETREIGVHWGNLFQPGSGGENDISMGNVFMILLFDTLLYLILTIYIDGINPGVYGIAKPLTFPFRAILVCIQNLLSKKGQVTTDETRTLRIAEEGLKPVPCIQIKNLRKQYDYQTVVHDLTFDIPKKSITILLGHNGAGKTTTMSIITGMTPATSGTVEINGVNIMRDIDKVRKKMGLCPQHNLLFPDLTVREHFKFFAMLKGSNCREAEHEAANMLKKLGLHEKGDNLAHTLSGGMKRKVCLGMALIGNSEVLILDEPTSGMDPESRRKVWDMLLDIRKEKTVLITTHFMEEADALGDYIAIMANGTLQCFGTPIALKNKYATGYHLSLILKSREHLSEIKELIHRVVDQAQLEHENGVNVIFTLPLNHKNKFPKMFSQLEANDLVDKMDLTITTLNDVFLKAGGGISSNSDTESTKTELTKMKRTSFRTKFTSLFYKRIYFTKRKFYWYIPGVLVFTAMLLATLCLGQRNNNYYAYGGPTLNLTLKLYGKTEAFYNATPSAIGSRLKDFYGLCVERQGSDAMDVKNVTEAIMKKGIENIAFYKKHMVAAAEFKVDDGGDQLLINAMYSSSALHGIPISINLVTNALAKSLLGDEFRIDANHAPLRTVNTDVSPSELDETQVSILWLIVAPIGMLFLMSNAIVFPNIELSTNYVHLQIMAGVQPYWYWLSNIACDFVLFAVKLVAALSSVALISFIIYQETLLSAYEYGVLFRILLLYAFSSLPFAYLFGYKKTIAGGFALFTMLGMFTGIVPTVVVAALHFSAEYVHTAEILLYIFIILFPHFGLTYFCVSFARYHVRNYNWIVMDAKKKDYLCQAEPNPCCFGQSTVECSNYQNFFHKEEYINVCLMLVSALLYFVILVLLQSQRIKSLIEIASWTSLINLMKGSSKSKRLEYPPTANGNSDTGTLRAKNLKKSYGYGTELIVKDVSITLEKNSCYGLLGVNGAGKTTTFRILTKDTGCDDGTVVLKNGNDEVDISQSGYTEKLGYCPQYDSLNYQLTGNEILTIMALLRGYPKDKADQAVKELLKLFELEKYADKPCLTYSGGNKRKLNACLAFVGLPEIILLDEPTSGVDPASRRNFWNTLSAAKKTTSFLLCSHSMEECEALCDRIAIMKGGKIEVEGNLLELKQQYHGGYTVTFKLKESKSVATTDIDEVDSVGGSCEEMSPAKIIEKKLKAELKDEHGETLCFHVKDPNKTLSEIFNDVEVLKGQHSFIEDYTISQSSLEDVFLSIANPFKAVN